MSSVLVCRFSMIVGSNSPFIRNSDPALTIIADYGLFAIIIPTVPRYANPRNFKFHHNKKSNCANV